jgi:hypothetical protein
MNTTTTIETSVNELIDLTLKGQWESAYEKFYHEEVEKTDLDGNRVKGFEQNLKNGRDFSSRISNVREFSCAGSVVSQNRSFIIWSFDFDVDGQPLKVTEVAIQDWQDGKIIKERFLA